MRVSFSLSLSISLCVVLLIPVYPWALHKAMKLGICHFVTNKYVFIIIK